jgi:hypothetical protein
VGGIGVYFIQPVFSSNPAFLTKTTLATTPPQTQTRTTDFNWNLEAAPQFWLGYRLGNDCLVRARYWNFDASSDGISVVHPVDPAGTDTTVATLGAVPIVATTLTAGNASDVLAINSALRLNVFDLEFARGIIINHWTLEGSVGVRYADLEQTYQADLLNAGNPALGFVRVERHQRETNRFRGAGATISGEIKCLLTGGLSLFGNARGSFLFGRSEQEATQQFVAATEQLFSAEGSRDLFVPVGELELGVEWAYTGRCARWSLQAGIVGQSWWNGGSATVPPGGTFASSEIGAPANSSVFQSSTSNLNFGGFSLRLGVQF